MPIRALPRIGDQVTVAFLSGQVGGVVAGADDEQRSVNVVTDDGETVRFALNRATGRFLSDGRQSGARLLFTR
jgi:phage baseplate assembly protein gpV